jgi:hypothetical protein
MNEIKMSRGGKTPPALWLSAAAKHATDHHPHRQLASHLTFTPFLDHIGALPHPSGFSVQYPYIARRIPDMCLRCAYGP